jgi:hypothetical protein
MPSTANPQKTPAKFPSFNWLRGVTDDTRISIVHRLVLIRLLLHRRNSDGQCSPGYDVVAIELGVHRATIFRAVDVAIGLGWMAQPIRHGRTVADFVFTFPSNVAGQRRQQSANVAPGRHQANPNVAGVQSQSRTRANTKSQRQRGSPAASTASTRNGSQNGRRERGKKESQPPDQVGKKKEAGGEAFDRFWAVYPKRVAKEAARKAFAKAAENGTDVEALIAGAQRYAVERQSQDPKYTKHPATWLNAGCWADETPGAPVIDEHGNVVAVEQPPPKRAGGQKTWAEVADELLAEVGNAVIN